MTNETKSLLLVLLYIIFIFYSLSFVAQFLLIFFQSLFFLRDEKLTRSNFCPENRQFDLPCYYSKRERKKKIGPVIYLSNIYKSSQIFLSNFAKKCQFCQFGLTQPIFFGIIILEGNEKNTNKQTFQKTKKPKEKLHLYYIYIYKPNQVRDIGDVVPVYPVLMRRSIEQNKRENNIISNIQPIIAPTNYR